MRSVQLLAVALAFSSAAQAKDVTVTFTDQEQQAFVVVMDAATRSGGLAATQGTLYFYNKMQTAISAATAPKPPEPVKEAPSVADTPADLSK